ncbi:serine hydrolase [Cryobacterium sp. PAMC25264]|uniref:serine hydrolase n=1 Tax=Cryobacterium sp. PAMC25264 TaxID=2861288 RepID=UPI001C634DFA|nr:serine hydrolase [Cryobacterium sp. PAMC25264]QYF74451.1 serine hydrolase [Cryobacterium sp. PAMC25264]
MSSSNQGRIRVVAVSMAAALTLGITACTAGATAEPSSSTGLAVALGEAPNQDVVDLYTDRDTAVSAAVDALPQLIEKALDQTGVPGAQVAVVSNGEVVFEEGYGVRDVTTQEPVDVGTVFQIASLSKPLSSSVVAKAITDDPALSWDDPVKDYLPDFALSDPYVTGHGKIADFFSHRTGIPTGAGDDLEDIGFDSDYILAHLNQVPLASFRDTYQYSNFGLTVGGEAVAASRGQTWAQTAQDLLFEPLGMTSTTTLHDNYLAADDRAAMHARTGDGQYEQLFDRDADAEAPAGGVASTAGDIAKWMTMVLADGEVGGAEFIDPLVLAQTYSAHSITGGDAQNLSSRTSHYGFGTNVGSTVTGRVSISHSGAFGWGAATNATMIPDLNLGIVVLTNGAPSGVPEAIVSEFVDLIQFGAETRPWLDLWPSVFAHFSDPAGDLVGEEAPTDAAPAGAAGDYVGTYTSPYFGDFVVTEENGVLTGALGPDGGYTFELDPWDGDTLSFVPTGENALPGSLSSAVFVRDGERISGVTLTYFNKFPAPGQEPNGLGVFTRTD